MQGSRVGFDDLPISGGSFGRVLDDNVVAMKNLHVLESDWEGSWKRESPGEDYQVPKDLELKCLAPDRARVGALVMEKYHDPARVKVLMVTKLSL